MESSSVSYTSPGRVLVIVWALFLAIVVVYGHDAKQWAEASSNPMAQSVVLPAASGLDAITEAAGINALRDNASNKLDQIYSEGPQGGVIEAEEEELTDSEASAKPLYIASSSPSATQLALRSQILAPATERLNFQSYRASSAIDVALQGASGTPKKVLIVGASSIQEGLGTELERKFETYKDVEVMRFGQFNTGLANPSDFNWEDKMKELISSFKPDLIIAFWGENDCRGINAYDGKSISTFGTDAWEKAYAERVGKITKQMTAGGTRVVMLGVPIMRAKKFSNQVEQLNAVTKTATEANGGVYLALWPYTVDKDGKYMSSVTYNGKERLIRAGDGIHFTNHGSEYLAERIGEALSAKYGFKAK